MQINAVIFRCTNFAFEFVQILMRILVKPLNQIDPDPVTVSRSNPRAWALGSQCKIGLPSQLHARTSFGFYDENSKDDR